MAGLRPVDGRLDPRFLWHWLTHTKAELAAKGRGATFLQVNRADITEMALPLPPIEEQRRIAAILDAGAILRAACEQQLGILDCLPRRLFEQHARAVVGVKPLGDLVSSGQIGLVRAAADLREDGEHEYVRMDSITATGYFRSSILKRTNASISELAKYSVRDGDLILNTRNTRELVGKSAIYRGPVRLFNNNLLRLRFRDGVAPEFVHAYLNSAEGARALAARKSGTTSVFAIYARDLMTIEVPLASRTDQAQFAAVIHESELLRIRLMRRLTSAESLTSSLRARAFTRRL